MTTDKTPSAPASGSPTKTEPGREGPLIIPVHEEVLELHKREVDLGTVRVRKRVETVPVETTVETTGDEVIVERVPVDRPVEAPPAPWQEGDTWVIPVVEEVLVVEKRLVVREEVRVTRRRVGGPVPVRETLRREVVELEVPAAGGEAQSGAART
jgi:uncharacterized protein (TIGR02271 family)